jgi:hypothetical protein
MTSYFISIAYYYKVRDWGTHQFLQDHPVMNEVIPPSKEPQ